MVGRQGAEGDADEQRYGDGYEAHAQAYARADHQHAQHVASIGVGAEEEGALLDARLALRHYNGFAVVGVGCQAVARIFIFIYGCGGVGQLCAFDHVAFQRPLDVGEEEGALAAGFEGGQLKVLLVAEGRGVGRDEVAEDGHQGEKPYHHEAGHRQRVAPETPPRLPVEGTRFQF